MPKRNIPPASGSSSGEDRPIPTSKRIRSGDGQVMTGIEEGFRDIGLAGASDKGYANQRPQEPHEILRDLLEKYPSLVDSPQWARYDGRLFDNSNFIDQRLLSEILRAGEGNDKDERLDEWMARSLRTLVKRIQRFAESVPVIRDSERDALFYRIVAPKDKMGESLIRYLGCLAIGGPDGEESWKSLLADHDCRKALVIGIFGRVLKEHVFSHLFFGTTEENVKELSSLERELVNQDGFERTTKRREVSQEYGFNVAERDSQVENLTLQICELLSPFWTFRKAYVLCRNASLNSLIRNIVKEAWVINYAIRSVGDVVYHWPPTFKDEEFEPARMECINLDAMISNSPYDRKRAPKGGYDGAVLQKGREDESEAIVRVVCFPGLVAYRKGGGSLAHRQLEAEKRRGDDAPPDVRAQRRRIGGDADSYTGAEGFRSRVVCKSIVMLQWGKQRLLTREAGTSAHIDAVRDGNMAKYAENSKGYRELWDLHEEFKARKERPQSSRNR